MSAPHAFPSKSCSWSVPAIDPKILVGWEEYTMQNGSIMQTERQLGAAVWEFRWREPGPDGKRKHRRMVIGSVDELRDVSAVRQRITALGLEINCSDIRMKDMPLTISELVDHYRQRELKPDTVWKTYSTKVTYQGYLNKWILPRWGSYALTQINAGEVEVWLRSLPLARSSCAKIRNLMSTVFNHVLRHEICTRNPIQLVRQSAKRKKIPSVLSASEVKKLIGVLAMRERTLVLLDVGTGLRMSELFALKWQDQLSGQRNQCHSVHGDAGSRSLQNGSVAEACP